MNAEKWKLQKLTWKRMRTTKYLHFCGVRIRQSYTALYMIEEILNLLRPRKIIEFGAWKGGLTLFLNAWAEVNSARVFSLDNQDLLSNGTRQVLLESPNTEFHLIDSFSKETYSKIRDFMGDDLSFVYCDNGDKERELNQYCGLLGKGSVIGCHDYGTEVFKKNISRLFEDDFQPLLTDKQIKSLGNMQQFWMRK